MTDVRASAENTGGGEVKENLVDGESGTKWLTFAPTGWAEFDLDKPVRLVTYALTSANDFAERDPKDWTLQGSTDGKDWKTVDSRSGESFPERFRTKSYDLAEPAEYQHFRLDITKNNGADDILQLADVQFSTGGSGGPVPQDMLSLVDRGLSGSPTAKAGAGFTGKRALRYAGRHTADGRAYSYNKIFDVNVAVGRDTRLSYRIFPSMADGDRDYDATNVSVDLAFTDGTYLSGLGAVTSTASGSRRRRRARPRSSTSTSGTTSPHGSGPSRPARPSTGSWWRTTPPRARRSSAAGWTTSRSRAWRPRSREPICPTTPSPPAAPTPAAASRAATTSPRPPCRTASTSGRR